MIRPFGERALLAEVADWRRAQALAASLAAEPIDGVEAAVPALASVLVELRPEADAAVVATALEPRVDRPASDLPRRTRTIPVVYGGLFGPDLPDVADACGLSVAEYARRHAALELDVLFCGFAAGFAYLGEVPQPMRVPRLDTPRIRVPAGSVAVAGAMSGVYPAELPGGWRIIGRTPLVLFDPEREPPAYLAPGDVVRFEPMPVDTWPDVPTAPADW